jgi:PAS domain S-box-containing protein
MDTKLKILILDDSLTDIKLIKYEIENYFSDIEIEAVTNRKDFIIKLGKFKPNVVLSDYDLPGFDGLTALHITHEMYPDLPFIIITGSANEEFGILCLKRGAYDYILKNHLQKIPVAIEEALNRYELIKENKRVYDELRESEKKFRLLAENAQDIIFRYELLPQKGFSFISPSVTKITGYSTDEFYSDPDFAYKIMHPDDIQIFDKVDKGEIKIDELLSFRVFNKDGNLAWLELKAIPIFEGKDKIVAIEGIARNVTERVKLQEEIKERQEHFEKLADSTTTAIFVYQGEYFVYANKATERITGYTKDELLKIKFYELVHPDFRELVKERGLKRQKGESVPTNYEFKIITKDGKEKWIDFTGSLISWFGKPAGLGTAYDITPLKNAIESLEKAQQRWMAIFENAPVGILIENSMGTIVNVNKKYEEITGYSREELIGKPIHILASPENKDKVDEHIQRILRGESLDHTVESINKNGSRIYVHLIETKYILPDGSPGILSICEDITEKVLLENQILEREKKLRTIFETANEGIAIADHNNVLTDVNKKFCEMTGYSREEIIGKNFGEFFLLEEDRKEQEIREQNRQQGIAQQFEVRLRRKDNSLIWTRVSATGIFDDGKYLGSFAFFTDITEQKKLEEELKQSEEQFRLIWENSNDGMTLTDEEGKVILANPAFCKIIGLPKEEIEGKFLSEIYSYNPLRKLEILKKHRERFISGKIRTRFETLVTLHDGRKIWLDVSNSFINVGGKKLLLGIFRDITDKKKLSEELAKSEKLFRNVWENSTDAMILTDKFGNIRLVNDALCKMVELPKDKLMGSPFKIVFHTDIRENIFNIHLAKFSDKQLNTNFEGEAILHNGKKIWIDARFSIIQTDDGELFLAIIRDITERKKLIDDLIKAKEDAEEANRLKSGFISMMSHEIRTPLNVIIGFNTVIRELFDKGDDEEVSRYFEAVENASMRLLDTINKILDISRIEAGEFQLNLVEMDLNKKI